MRVAALSDCLSIGPGDYRELRFQLVGGKSLLAPLGPPMSYMYMATKNKTIPTAPEYRAKAAALRTISTYDLSPASQVRMLSMASKLDAIAARSILPALIPSPPPPTREKSDSVTREAFRSRRSAARCSSRA
jgi:hypothetical protein